MQESLTIHSSTLQFLSTNLQEEKYSRIEARNILLEIYFVKNRRSMYSEIFLNEAVPRFVINRVINKKLLKPFKNSFLVKLQISTRHFY